MRRTAAVLALLLSACHPQAPDGSRAQPPADAAATHIANGPAGADDAPAAFRGDFNVHGAEPFWAARIRVDGITVMRPQIAPATAPNNGPHMAGPQAVWAASADGEPLVVAMVQQDCTDGMSDRVYGYAAELQLGDESFTGCAERAQE
ncbi:COG3650 family protein [Phenylobacterium sp.]|uniref:COG3650 family protein n=1 Tax=Phenylobacterium sp. TaxID=1871053 RepID=UPI0035B00450